MTANPLQSRRASTPAPSGLAGEAVAFSTSVSEETQAALKAIDDGQRAAAAYIVANPPLFGHGELAATPSIPAGGVREALEKLADRVRALLLVDRPASWEERIAIANELDALASSLSLPAGGVAVSEATELAAKRWNALLRCARIRMQGSAGFDPKTGERQEYRTATGEYEKSDEGWVHFGAEFWSIYPDHEDDDRANRWGTIALTALADDVLLKEQRALEAALSPEAKTGER